MTKTPSRALAPGIIFLHNTALPIVFATIRLHTQRHPRSLCEGLVDAPIPHRGALQIPQGVDPPRDLEALVVIYHILLLPLRAVCRLLFVASLLAQIALEGNEDQLCALAVLGNLGDPFGLDILERIFRVDAEAEHDGVGIVVGERS